MHGFVSIFLTMLKNEIDFIVLNKYRFKNKKYSASDFCFAIETYIKSKINFSFQQLTIKKILQMVCFLLGFIIEKE